MYVVCEVATAVYHLDGEDVAPVARIVVLVALLAGEAAVHGLVHLLVAACMYVCKGRRIRSGLHTAEYIWPSPAVGQAVYQQSLSCLM